MLKSATLLFGLLCLVFAQSNHTELLVQLPLDDDSDATIAHDESPHDVQCVFQNATPGLEAPSLPRNGSKKIVPGFDGWHGRVECAELPAPRSAFTYDLWFRPACDFKKEGSSAQILLAGLSPESPTPMIFHSKGRIYCQILLNIGNSSYYGTTFALRSTTVGFTNESFHHVACTWDGQTMQLFINGTLENHYTSPSRLTQVPTNGISLATLMGAYAEAGRLPQMAFNGELAYTRVQDGLALSAEGVLARIEAGKKRLEEGSVMDDDVSENVVPEKTFSPCGIQFTTMGFHGHTQVIAVIGAALFAALPIISYLVYRRRQRCVVISQGTPATLVLTMGCAASGVASCVLCAAGVGVLAGPHVFEADYGHDVYVPQYVHGAVVVAIQAVVFSATFHETSPFPWVPAVVVVGVEIIAQALGVRVAMMAGRERENWPSAMWAVLFGVPLLVCLRRWFRRRHTLNELTARERVLVSIFLVMVAVAWGLRRLVWMVTDAKHGLSDSLGFLLTMLVDLGTASMALAFQVVVPLDSEGFFCVLMPSPKEILRFLVSVAKWEKVEDPCPSLHFRREELEKSLLLNSDEDVSFSFPSRGLFSDHNGNIQGDVEETAFTPSTIGFRQIDQPPRSCVRTAVGVALFVAATAGWAVMAKYNNTLGEFAASHVSCNSYLRATDVAATLENPGPSEVVYSAQCQGGCAIRTNRNYRDYMLQQLGLDACYASIEDVAQQSQCVIGQGWNDVYGAENEYADHSNLCRAALHAGFIGESGGCVSFKFTGPRTTYDSSISNGVESMALNFTAFAALGGAPARFGVSFVPFEGHCPFRLNWTLGLLAVVAMLGLAVAEPPKPVLFLATVAATYWTELAMLKNLNFAVPAAALPLDDFGLIMAGAAVMYVAGPRYSMRDRSDLANHVEDDFSHNSVPEWRMALQRVRAWIPSTPSGLFEHNFFFYILPLMAGCRFTNWWADETTLLENLSITFDTHSPEGTIFHQVSRLPTGGIIIIYTTVILVVFTVVFHMYLMWRDGAIVLMLGSYASIAIAAAVISAILKPTHEIHIHHCAYPLILVPIASYPNRFSCVAQAFVFGVAVQGCAAWFQLASFWVYSIPRSF